MAGKPENLKPFTKNDPRRHNGRPKGAHNVSTILGRMLKKVAPEAIVDKKFVREYTAGKKRVTIGDVIACRLLFEAINEGSIHAIKEINDRTEGKSTQGLEVSSPDGSAIKIDTGPQVVVYMPDNGRGDADTADNADPGVEVRNADPGVVDDD
jgi:hypothetical protein